MLILRKIRPDKYLRDFLDYCKNKFGDGLAAIVIYGSYSLGYFDEKKSDYDIFVIFKDKVPVGKEEIKRKFKRISLNYYLNIDGLLKRLHLGHWTSYITLLKSARVLYYTKEYKSFLKKLKKINLFEEFIDVGSVELKSINRANILKKLHRYKALKWALPTIRAQLQMLTYARYNELIWNLNSNLIMNKDILTKEEINFMKDLYKKLRLRSENFSKRDKRMSLNLIYKLNKEIVFHLVKLQNE